ncbi:MAG: TonB-dependent receptor, partial [Gammaproteobacteria bacterium]|nr:TonB-dependent receptor [Gammaproteobacteria bacterium]
PLDSIAQIEIVHGSSSVLYGDNAVSGVINIVTKNGFDGKQGKIKLQAGSFQTQRLSGDFRTQKDDTALSLAFDGLKSNGYRDNSAFNNFSLISDISKEHGSHNYGARIHLSRDDVELPGALDEATYESDPRESTQPLEKANERRISLEGYFSGKIFAGDLTLSKKRQEATVFGDTEAELGTLSFTPRAKRQYGDHSLVAGIDVYHSRLETKAEFPNFFPPPAEVKNLSETTRESLGIYFSDTFRVSTATTINYGFRHQRVKLNIDNNGNISGKSDDSGEDNLNAADITLSHIHQYGGTNYIRFAHSFRSPVLDEMWDYFSGTINLLDPQTGNHVEIGTRQTFANGMMLSANLFRMNIKDEIAFDGITNVNLDKTRHDGLNVNLSQQLTRDFNASLGLAIRRATFENGPNKGSTIPLVPHHKVTLSGQYQLTQTSQFVLNATRTGERYFGDDNANAGKKMPAYTMLNLSYSKAFDNWKARVLIQNLNNVKTADSGYYASWLTPPYTYYPLPERAVYLTFEGNM